MTHLATPPIAFRRAVAIGALVGAIAAAASPAQAGPGQGRPADDRPVLGSVKPFHRMPHLRAMQVDSMALDVDPIDLDEIARPGRWRIEDLPLDLANDVDLVVEPFSVGARGMKAVVVDEHGRERRLHRLARFWRGHVAGDESSRTLLRVSSAGCSTTAGST